MGDHFQNDGDAFSHVDRSVIVTRGAAASFASGLRWWLVALVVVVAVGVLLVAVHLVRGSREGGQEKPVGDVFQNNGDAFKNVKDSVVVTRGATANINVTAVVSSAVVDRPGETALVVTEHVADGFTYIEIAPRFATIAPFLVAVDKSEKDSGNVLNVLCGPPKVIPQSSVMFGRYEGEFTQPDGTATWFVESKQTAASPTTSFYLMCRKKPRRLWCGPSAAAGLIELNR